MKFLKTIMEPLKYKRTSRGILLIKKWYEEKGYSLARVNGLVL